MIDLTALENGLYAWVRSRLPASGWPAVWGDQNAPKPGSQLIELRRSQTAIQKIGDDVRGAPDAQGVASKLGTRELFFSIRSYGAGGMVILEDLVSRLDDPETGEILYGASLAFVSADAILNLTSLYGQQFKEVGSVDLRFRTHSFRQGSAAEPASGYIQSVELDRTTIPPGQSGQDDQIEVQAP